MFEEIALFKDEKTHLYLFLNNKISNDSAVYAHFDILNKETKSGYLQLKHCLKQKNLEICNFVIDYQYRNKGFATRLYEYGIPIIMKEVEYVWAKAFYSAETILKNKNWHSENNIYKNKG